MVFILKEPIFTLTLILISLAIFLNNLSITVSILIKEKFKHLINRFIVFFKEEITSISLFLFVFLYSFISIFGNLNIGFRHLFPIIPFIFILVALTIFKKIRKEKEEYDRYLLFISVLFLSVLLFAETISVYPYYMSYFNQAAGGPKYGYRYVTDSNADWGQDLKRLKIWINKYNNCVTRKECFLKYNRRGYIISDQPISKLRVNYFGGADPKYYLGDIFIEWWDSKRPIETGWYAISTNFLQGSIYDKEKKDEESYRWLKNIKPDYRVGTSILIYYITEEKLQKSNWKVIP